LPASSHVGDGVLDYFLLRNVIDGPREWRSASWQDGRAQAMASAGVAEAIAGFITGPARVD
jgi:hypothetical protein